MSNRLKKQRPAESDTAVVSGSSRRQRIIDVTKVLLDIANQSSDWLPPLKGCLGGITALVKHYKQSEEVKHKLEQLIPWLTRLRETLTTVDPNGDRQEIARRAQLERALKRITQESRAMLEKGQVTRIIDKTQDHRKIAKLVEELRQEILIYQLLQQQSVSRQVAELTSSFNTLLKLCKKVPGVKGEIESALGRLDKLSVGSSDSGNKDDTKRRMVRFEVLEGIKDELERLSERSSSAGYRENDDDARTVCELAESVNDVVEEQLTQQKARHPPTRKLIDSGKPTTSNNRHDYTHRTNHQSSQKQYMKYTHRRVTHKYVYQSQGFEYRTESSRCWTEFSNSTERFEESIEDFERSIRKNTYSHF